jgi:phospho-N-acetylmuramoyl-pentapeptide-transferase
MVVIDIVKVFVPATAAFAIGILLTPLLTHYLYKYRAWKKRSGKHDILGNDAPTFNALHATREVNTPRMGGIVIWGSTLITVLAMTLVAHLFPGAMTAKLDFLSRSQTWLPLFVLVVGAFVGLLDDILEIRMPKDGERSKGLSLPLRLLIVGALALFSGWWFYAKLDVVGVGIPLDGTLVLGPFVILLFVLITLALYAGGIIDGIDGLAGGVFGAIFAAYAGIAFFQNQIDLAAFCATLVGSILAFLWYNIPPARFYMSETGTMGLTITLAVVAFLTDTIGEGYGLAALPVIAFLLFLTVATTLLQVLSKKYRGGKKIFRIAPLHHHFEAIGWPAAKVTMRYWVIAIICAVLGMTIALIG